MTNSRRGSGGQIRFSFEVSIPLLCRSQRHQKCLSFLVPADTPFQCLRSLALVAQRFNPSATDPGTSTRPCVFGSSLQKITVLCVFVGLLPCTPRVNLFAFPEAVRNVMSSLEKFHPCHNPFREVRHGVAQVSHSQALSVRRNPPPQQKRTCIGCESME